MKKRTFRIIHYDNGIDTRTVDVKKIIDFLYNYVDFDFRDWSSLQDDDLAYKDGKIQVSNHLLSTDTKTPFSNTYELYGRKYGWEIKII